jgi:hypothetical protein
MGPMNRGYAFGFLIVLLVAVLGLYVAFTGFVSSRDALRAQLASQTSTPVVQITPNSSGALPTAAVTVVFIPTSAAGITATATITLPVVIAEPTLAPTVIPIPKPTKPPVAEPTLAPTVPLQPPTPVPVPAYPFRLAGPAAADSSYSNCCYIHGTVRDAAGNLLEGVQVQVANEWTGPFVTVTKGGVDLGKYDVPIGADKVTWYVILIDAAGKQISSQVQVQFDPSAAKAYRVDWQRSY